MTTTRDASISPVPATVLAEALEQVLSDYFGRPRTVTDLERRPSPYSSSYNLERIDLTLDGHQPLRLVFKDLSPDAVPAHARWIKPGFLVHPEREIATYRTVLPQAPSGPPICYGTIIDPARRRYWLFLEYIRGVPLWQVGDMAAWEEAARWLAVLHTRTPVPGGPWLRYNAAYYRRWMRRVVHVVRRRDPTALDALGLLIDSFSRLAQRLEALPRAFLHGEFYPSNVLVQHEASALAICPIDWEMAAVGPALMDLSALTSGDWSREQQFAMATAYRETLRDVQGHALPMDTLLDGLDACRLFQALQWLGWSLRWEPPDEHATDWLSEAVALAEQVAY